MAVTWVHFVRCLGEFLNVFREAELLAQRCLRKNKTTLLLFFQGVSVRPIWWQLLWAEEMEQYPRAFLVLQF